MGYREFDKTRWPPGMENLGKVYLKGLRERNLDNLSNTNNMRSYVRGVLCSILEPTNVTMFVSTTNAELMKHTFLAHDKERHGNQPQGSTNPAGKEINYTAALVRALFSRLCLN